MSEIPIPENSPIRIDVDAIQHPTDYMNSRPDGYESNPDRDAVKEYQLRDVRERATVEQSMGAAVDGVFDQFANNVIIDESGTELLAVKMPFNGARARLTLTRANYTNGNRVVTMAFAAKKAWANGLVYTDGPSELPVIDAGTVDPETGRATVYKGKSMVFNNQDPQIAFNGKMWLHNLTEAILTPTRADLPSGVGRTALRKLFKK